MSTRRPVPGCNPPKFAVRYQSVVQAVAVLASIAMDALWGSSPEPGPAGPNAEALTGVRTRVLGAGGRAFFAAGTGAAAWACLRVAVLVATTWLVRDWLMTRLEWKTTTSATASTAHATAR